MIWQGIFIDTKGVIHQFYEAEEHAYYRLDICAKGTPFIVDPGGVEYSLFKKKATFTYGDEAVHKEYQDLRDAIYNTHGEEFKETRWSEGKFYCITTKVNKAKNFNSRTTVCNGAPVEFEAHIGEQFLQYAKAPQPVLKLDPLNISDYKEKAIDVSTEDHATYTTPYYPYETLVRRYDLKHIESKDFVVATDPIIAERRLKEWYESDAKFKGFDTETTGLDIWMYGEDRLTGIILSIGKESSTYFPFGMKKMPNLSKAFMDKLMSYCKEQENQLVAHNKKFDRQVMMMEGYDLRIKWDTMIISFMLNPITVKGAHALKELMLKLNGKKFLELSEIFISAKNIDFSVLPEDITRLYACADSTNAVELLEYFIPQVPADMWPIILIEMQLADLKADQEYYGIRVDVQKYKDNFENCEYVLDMLLSAFRKMTHEDGNINSADVLSTLMYDKMGCKVLMRTKTGKRSTSGKAIDKLASKRATKPHNITENIVDLRGKVVIKAETLANSQYPALVILSKYREYVKRKTAFYARFERTMKTGRVHFWINQNGASSGRQSSPMHQLPPELKDVIISDSDLKDLWGPDYSQVELRMIAFLAGETELIEMMKDPSNDVHRLCASLITNKEQWEITKAERNIKKRVNFGVVYLISGFGLAGQLYGPGYSDEQREFCQEQLDAFYNRFKRIDLYLKKNATRVREKGYMRTKFNRIKYFNEIFDPDITNKKRASLIRQANNMPVQGTAADLMKIAEVNMYEWIREHGWNELDKDGLPFVRVMLSIHDEVLISASRDIAIEEIMDMITTCMQIEIEGAPPFFVQPAKMSNWGGHSDDAIAVPIPYRDQLVADYRRTGKSVFKRTFYSVDMDVEKRSELNNDMRPLKEKIKSYMPSVTFTKLYGDYSDELTKEGRVAALEAYISSGAKTYTDDNYMELLNAYRDKELYEYMHGLIEQYGNDPDVVADHVRHPSLTHELIDRFKDGFKNLDLDHVEQIHFATKEYMKKGGVGSVATRAEKEETKVMDKDLFFNQSENLYQFDKDGNVIYEEEPDEDDGYDISDSDTDYILYKTAGIVYKAWRMVNTIVLDVDNLSFDQMDQVIAKVWQSRKDDGFYKVYLLVNGKMVDTKFRVEELDLNEVSAFITKLEKMPA